jgi:YD repeat-containing protein
VDLEYTFSLPPANNGQITQMIDHASGETVSYTYDSLKRLATAGSGSWGLRFSYDGFGNLTDKIQTLGLAAGIPRCGEYGQ